MNGQLYQECEVRGCSIEPVCANCFYCEEHCTCPSQDEIDAERSRAAEARRLAAERQAVIRANEEKRQAWVANATDGLVRSFVLDSLVGGSVAWRGSWAYNIPSRETEYPDWRIRELGGVEFYSHYYGNAHVIYAPQSVVDDLIREFHRSYAANYDQTRFSEWATGMASRYSNSIGGDVAARAIELGLVGISS